MRRHPEPSALASSAAPANSDKWMRTVGTDSRDVSAEGVHDLYGNPFELVADLYVGDLDAHSSQDNPTVREASDLPTGVVPSAYYVVRGNCDGTLWPDFDYAHKGCPVWFRTYDSGVAGQRLIDGPRWHWPE